MTGFYYEGKGDLVVCNKKAEGPHVLYLSNILPDNCALNVQYIKGGAHDKKPRILWHKIKEDCIAPRRHKLHRSLNYQIYNSKSMSKDKDFVRACIF